MEVYLRSNSDGTYLMVNRGESVLLTTGSSQAGFNSLITIEAYNPKARGVLSEQPPEPCSDSLVTLRSPDGKLIAPDESGVLRPNGATAAQPGHNVYRLVKVGGKPGDAIEPGDTIALRFVPPAEGISAPWMTVQPSSEGYGEVMFRGGIRVPQATEYFEVVRPIDLVAFCIEYDDLYDEVIGQVALSGPALPGGHMLRIESPDGGDIIPSFDVLIKDSTWFPVVITDEFKRMTPADKRKIAVRASFLSTGTCLENPLVLEGDRAYFMQMEIQKILRVRPKNPTTTTKVFDVDVLLKIDPYDRRLVKSSDLPLSVSLTSDQPAIVQNLSQAWSRLAYDHAIPFRFTIEQPDKDAEPVTATICARYRLNRIERQSRFLVKISHKGILVEPR